MNEIIREFLLETHESLAQLDLDLVKLEEVPDDAETIARVFRALHTVKGSAGFLGLPKLQAVAHAAENLLTKIRIREIAYAPVIASALLGSLDAIRTILGVLEKTSAEGDGEYGGVIGRLAGLLDSDAVASPQPTAVSEFIPSHLPQPPPPAVVAQQSPRAEIEPLRNAKPPSLVQAEPAEPRATTVADSALRVDVGLLDQLMTLVGELVLARNQIKQLSGTQENAKFLSAVQRLNLLTAELQANVLKTRMQPIGNMWGKFPRVVRDLAVACGKRVRLELDGEEIELDKTIVEAIRDPLTHLVRNAIDHGFETPEERIARGKPEEGRLALRASHEGGKVIIRISDDGRGIDPSRVREKAIAAKLLTAEQARRLSEWEIVEMIFLPGFSTTDKVTNFSGRGVGMDVVRTNVKKIGGSVEIESKLGRGTTLTMKIPLTLAIIPVLTVSAGGDRYAIHQASLLEMMRLEGEQATTGIESFRGATVYRLRGNLLPLVYLNRELRIGEDREGSDGAINIVVLRAEDEQFGLVVDAIHDTEEIVVKPLQRQVKGVGAFVGATIMGDGKVALILDVPGLAQRAGIISGSRGRSHGEDVALPVAPKESFLLFSTRAGDRMAVSLSLVARLEEFPRSALERIGNRYVVQYRGAILPLVNVAGLLGRKRNRSRSVRAKRSDSPVQVVVCTAQNRTVGLLVGRILDIVEEAVITESKARRRGVLFTAVVQEKVTEFLDVNGLIERIDQSIHDPTVAEG